MKLETKKSAITVTSYVAQLVVAQGVSLALTPLFLRLAPGNLNALQQFAFRLAVYMAVGRVAANVNQETKSFFATVDEVTDEIFFAIEGKN